MSLSDRLYQQPVAVDGNIVIIKIDEKALDRFGVYQNWNREKVAEVIEKLNQSEDKRPNSPEADEALVDAMEDNVVPACAGAFDSGFVENGTGFIHNSFRLIFLKSLLTSWNLSQKQDIYGVCDKRQSSEWKLGQVRWYDI